MSRRLLAGMAMVLGLAGMAWAEEWVWIEVPDGSLRDIPEEAQAVNGWWVRIGERLYSPVLEPGADPDRSHYYLTPGRELPWPLEQQRVGGGNGWHLLHLPAGPPKTGPADLTLCRHSSAGFFLPVRGGERISVPVVTSGSSRGGAYAIADSAVQVFVDGVDKDRYYQNIVDLAAFGSRNSYQPGVLLARDFIKGEFESLGLTTTTPTFTVSSGAGTTTGYNVVGKLIGTTYPNEFLVVGGHYDSLPGTGSAPGAEDNASGTAGVMEMARVVAAAGPQQRSIYFMTYSGEEQGLDGSAALVAAMTPAEKANCRGAIIMDMISYTADAEQDVLLETNGTGAPLLNHLATAATDFTDLVVHTSFSPFGSDHIPYINAGMQSVLTIDDDWDVYPAYHQSTDATSLITREVGAKIVQMNVATLVRLANPDPVSSSVSDWNIVE